jgi:hypothetical protein
MLDFGGPPSMFRAPSPGAIAQLGERCVRNAEVRGSIPRCSTQFHPETWAFLGLGVNRCRDRATPRGGRAVSVTSPARVGFFAVSILLETGFGTSRLGVESELILRAIEPTKTAA